MGRGGYDEASRNTLAIGIWRTVNVLELAIVTLALVWLVGAVRLSRSPSYLDLTLAAIVCLVLVLHLLATVRSRP